MRISLLILSLVLSVPVQAQDHWAQMDPSERTIDSLRTRLAIAEAEVRRADLQAELFAHTIAEVFRGDYTHSGYTLSRSAKPNVSLSPYITAGGEGEAHTEASVYGAIGLEYQTGAFGVDCALRYQHFADSTERWKPVFYGGLKVYLR